MLEAVFLFGWFLYSSWRDNPKGWYLPFDSENVFNVGTVICQVAIVLAVLIAMNRWMARKTLGR